MIENNNKEITLDIIKLLPKAELHRHLDGSIRISTLLELAKEQNVELPTYDQNELAKLIHKDENCSGLVNFLEAFQYTCSVLQHAYAITRVFYEMCEDAVADGVSYLEIRFSPVLHTSFGLSLSEVMEAVCDGMAIAELNLPIKARIIVCGLRHLDPSISKDLAEITWRYRHKGAIAFDLAGPEDGFSSKYHKEAFSIIRNKGINCTLHSGEDSNWTSVADSIHHCGAHRIGHGIAIQQNEELLNHVVNRRIPIECCITSNYQIKAIGNASEHPIRKYFDSGAIVSISCDNCTMSNITLSGEYKLAIDTFNFKVEEVIRLIDYSFAASFIDPPLKINIRRESFKKALKIFQTNGYDISGVIDNKFYYFEEIGLDVELEIQNNLANNFSLGKNVIRNYPQITLELLENLPKSDLHCRFDGGVSIEQIWNEVQLLGIDKCEKSKQEFLKRLSSKHLACYANFKDFKEFKSLIQSSSHTPQTIRLSKEIINLLLQTPEQINRAFDDIIKVALKDKVQYLELMIRPNSHSRNGLTKEQVLALIIENKDKWEKCSSIKIGLVVFSSSTSDDPIETLDSARLAIANRSSGVIGFGIFGADPISPTESRHFSQTFSLLKENNFNLVQFAGKSDVESLISTIHCSGSTRLSGAFQSHKIPRLMSYLGNYSIPVEISLTEKLKSFTSDDLSFTTPIRHLLDGKCPVVICSFRSSLYPYSRSKMYYKIVKNAKLDFKQVIRLLKNPFAYNFQSHQQRIQLVQQFNKLSKEYLNSANINYSNIII
ncbi:hypothetical protein ACTFIW_013193 [Dictyostelium discoideum]